MQTSRLGGSELDQHAVCLWCNVPHTAPKIRTMAVEELVVEETVEAKRDCTVSSVVEEEEGEVGLAESKCTRA